jgi:hypothetical protein
MAGLAGESAKYVNCAVPKMVLPLASLDAAMFRCEYSGALMRSATASADSRTFNVRGMI